MTAVTVTVSDKLDFEDATQIDGIITAMTSTNTNDRFLVLQGANNKSRVIKINIE